VKKGRERLFQIRFAAFLLPFTFLPSPSQTYDIRIAKNFK
jgi:hypothetical protein